MYEYGSILLFQIKFRHEYSAMHIMCRIISQASTKRRRRAQMYIDYILTSFSMAKTPTILPNALGKRTHQSLASANIARFKTYPVASPSSSPKSKQQVVLLPYYFVIHGRLRGIARKRVRPDTVEMKDTAVSVISV